MAVSCSLYDQLLASPVEGQQWLLEGAAEDALEQAVVACVDNRNSALLASVLQGRTHLFKAAFMAAMAPHAGLPSTGEVMKVLTALFEGGAHNHWLLSAMNQGDEGLANVLVGVTHLSENGDEELTGAIANGMPTVAKQVFERCAVAPNTAAYSLVTVVLKHSNRALVDVFLEHARPNASLLERMEQVLHAFSLGRDRTNHPPLAQETLERLRAMRQHQAISSALGEVDQGNEQISKGHKL